MKQKRVLFVIFCLILSVFTLMLISCNDEEDILGIKEVKVIDDEVIVIYSDNTEACLGTTTSVDWDAVFKAYKKENPNYDKSKSEWTEEILAGAVIIPKYTVTFDTGNTGINIPSQTVKEGEKISSPKINMYFECCEFLGWFLNDEEWVFTTDTVTQNITLVAKWERISLPEQINILVTRYDSSSSAPWGQMELNPSSFGEKINQAHLDRQAFILNMYGVSVNYIESRDAQNVENDISSATAAKDITYEIAYPRAQEAQAIVSYLYDMRLSDHINFKNSYFSQSAFEAFTVCERTLFIAGDADFSDNQASYMLFVNKDMLEEIKPGLSDELYAHIKNGTWTYDMFANLSKQAKAKFGASAQADDGVYGYGAKNVSRLFQYADIKKVDVDPDTGFYRFAFGLDLGKGETVVSNAFELLGSDWARTSWGGDFGANLETAFLDGRVLFYDDIALKIDDINDIDFSLGLAPFPKLNEQQEDYCVPLSTIQPTLMCIPKCTSNRVVSEIFISVLSQTGSIYIMEAYYDKFESKMDKETANNDMEILEKYIMDNIVYDAGSISAGWAGLGIEFDIENMDPTKSNNFETALSYQKERAEEKIYSWNMAWYKKAIEE